ncbi:MAG: SDR family oxidoreductase [Cyanobium sp. Prado107]|jgi:NAD(P)-dependent dehydrogenase (short-subunit alcohol dehydrogenase family)|nr:SDR family oxidoreductase [Cyanobium sp. Prado107]
MNVKTHFRDKGCIVTGAASGIGLALTEALLEAGAFVFMADLDQERLATAMKELADHSERVQSMVVDVTSLEQVQRMVEEAAARHGSLDVLFNNAGIGGTEPIWKATLEHWRRILDINLWSVIYGVHATLPIMRRQGHGHIVNTSSIAGLIPFPFQALYCTTKYAVAGLSESLRFELADEGIHVSVVCPGNVISRIWGSMNPPEDAIPAAAAAKTILEGVANHDGIITLPESISQLWRQYWASPESSENFLMEMARQRQNSFRTKGTYY